MPNQFFPVRPKSGLHFIGDEQASVFFHGLENDLEIFRRRGDESADALNRFGDEGGDLAAGARLDQVFDVFRAGDFAIGIFQAQRAAIAVRIDGVRDAHADDAGFPPRGLRRHALGQRRSARIGVAQRHNVIRAGRHARQQDRGFVRLSAGAGEKAGLQRARSNLRDFFGQRHDGFVRIERGKMLQPVDLRLDRAR